MRIRKIIILITYTCLLSACAPAAVTKTTEKPIKTVATKPAPPAKTLEVTATSKTKKQHTRLNRNGIKFSPIAHAQTAELLDFIARFSELRPSTQKSIYTELKQALSKNKNDIKLNIKAAAILALPTSSLRDTAAAHKSLQTLLNRKALNTSDASLVKLLYDFTLEHHIQNQKIRDASKKHDLLKQKNKTLDQQLNDLKNIEKTMTERSGENGSNP